MKIDTRTAEAIGGMRPMDGSAPFASASLVVRKREAPGTIAQISRYEGDGFAGGDPLTHDEWRTLCEEEHAYAFAEPIPVQPGACMWLLRQNFEGRGMALSELRSAGVILGSKYDARTDTEVLVVRENEANRLRDGWAERAYTTALEQARIGRWARAVSLSEQAYVLGRGPISRHWALLSLGYRRVDRLQRAEGMVQVARRSHSEDFADDVLALRTKLEAELASASPSYGAADASSSEANKAAQRSTEVTALPDWRRDIRKAAGQFNRDGLKHLGSSSQKRVA